MPRGRSRTITDLDPPMIPGSRPAAAARADAARGRCVPEDHRPAARRLFHRRDGADAGKSYAAGCRADELAKEIDAVRAEMQVVAVGRIRPRPARKRSGPPRLVADAAARTPISPSASVT